MSKIPPKTFHSRVEFLLRFGPQRMSFSEASLGIGKGRNYLTNMLKNGQDPSIGVVLSLAKLLKTDPNDLLAWTYNGDRQIGPHKTLDKIVTRCVFNSEPCENLGRDLERVDLYIPPRANEKKLHLFRMGKSSLGAIASGAKSTEDFRKTLEEIRPLSLMEKFTSEYRMAAENGLMMNKRSRRIQLLTTKSTVNIDYLQTLLPTVNGNGTRLILNFSFVANL